MMSKRDAMRIRSGNQAKAASLLGIFRDRATFSGRDDPSCADFDRKPAGIEVAPGAFMMNTLHRPSTCRFSLPTLFSPWPLWLDAWNKPWSCARDGKCTLLSNSEPCRTCQRWEEERKTETGNWKVESRK
jgi:hypothetical protein